METTDTRYIGYITIDGGNRLEGWESSTHNAALRGTRRLLAGQGYRAVPKQSHSGHLVLHRTDGGTAIIEIEEVA